eukprot:gnl/MRDRNA2_/MRDRNA2_212688_c0_seq1.p1 gnl/MRDRNA2_/MRDRNA2_212688_c0~~gnl/MRDRNA2_/MRDRNA2_212688_c0_seq1.p1  ORF type:complete len:342 (+),score=63.62 gnl/MRDRNA2_/MRDRNA2_212688_c0_seq1:164-1189(+)
MSASKNKLAYVSLRIPHSVLQETINFYKNGLQYVSRSPGDESHTDRLISVRLVPGLPAAAGSSLSAGVEFLASPTITGGSSFQADLKKYQSGRTDVYWKIGLALHDVDASVEAINRTLEAGVLPGVTSVGSASQFFDVGYLVHLQDPAGFSVELLQTTFKDNVERRRALLAESHSLDQENLNSSPLAQLHGVVQGQITIRISDKEKSLTFYQEVLGMKLLCIETVDQYSFTLFFLGYPAENENPPNAENLLAVENREWCYQRPYTTLELQYKHGSEGSALRLPEPGESGFQGLVVQVGDSQLWKRLHEHGSFTEDGEKGRSYVVDPDGAKIFIEKAAQSLL